MRRWEREGSQKLMGRMAATLPHPRGLYGEDGGLEEVGRVLGEGSLLVSSSQGGAILAADPRSNDRATRRDLRYIWTGAIGPSGLPFGRMRLYVSTPAQ